MENLTGFDTAEYVGTECIRFGLLTLILFAVFCRINQLAFPVVCCCAGRWLAKTVARVQQSMNFFNAMDIPF